MLRLSQWPDPPGVVCLHALSYTLPPKWFSLKWGWLHWLRVVHRIMSVHLCVAYSGLWTWLSPLLPKAASFPPSCVCCSYQTWMPSPDSFQKLLFVLQNPLQKPCPLWNLLQLILKKFLPLKATTALLLCPCVNTYCPKTFPGHSSSTVYVPLTCFVSLLSTHHHPLLYISLIGLLCFLSEDRDTCLFPDALLAFGIDPDTLKGLSQYMLNEWILSLLFFAVFVTLTSP